MAQWERISLSAKAVKVYSGSEMKEEAIAAFGAKVCFFFFFFIYSSLKSGTGLLVLC